MKDRVIVITGASQGIGAALAQLAASQGALPVLVGRSLSTLEATARTCGSQALAIQADCTRRVDVEHAVQEVLARRGRIDVWVNNVGRGITRLPSQLTDEDLDDMMRINVKSAWYGVQAVLPHFKERGRGQIVNVSSMLGRVPFAVPRSAYNGAKHFLNALTANLREELKESHPEILMTLVSPGVVRTNFGLNALHGGADSRSFPESQSAEEVAAVIARAIEMGRTDVYTRSGAKARVAGYFSQIGEDA